MKMPASVISWLYRQQITIVEGMVISMEQYFISGEDREILRRVARRQAELAAMERNTRLKKEWLLHNELRGERPMIHLEAGTFEQELLPQRMSCTGGFAREVEANLYRNFLNQELFDDDRITQDYYEERLDTNFTLFGIDMQVQESLDSSGKKSLGHQFESILTDLEDDYHKLGETTYSVNPERTRSRMAVIEDAIGDILPVRLQGRCLYSVPTQMLVHIMSMENMMFNICDYPELFKTVMKRIADDTEVYFDCLEAGGFIMPTTQGEFLAQGSWCYNSTLPSDKPNGRFTTKDVWGFLDSQETVGISPEMFEEFIFPTYKQISERFGLLSYGCCEPVSPVWERCISKLDNLRKVSISPWCDEEYMGEQLRSRHVIFHRKPSPNYLGLGETLDEDGWRQHIRKSLKAATGCTMEITQRDVYTINNDEGKAKRYIDIIKEEIATCW